MHKALIAVTLEDAGDHRPSEQGADILYRIDDEMVPVRRLIHALQPPVVSPIKVLANMDLAEHRKATSSRSTTSSKCRTIVPPNSTSPARCATSCAITRT